MQHRKFTLDDLLSEMFPGTQYVPCYEELPEKRQFSDSLVEFAFLSSLYSEYRAVEQDYDINEILRLMKKQKPAEVSRFLETTLELYFSIPSVVRSVAKTPTPLFPHERLLADFDFNLLEPVYMRSR